MATVGPKEYNCSCLCNPLIVKRGQSSAGHKTHGVHLVSMRHPSIYPWQRQQASRLGHVDRLLSHATAYNCPSKIPEKAYLDTNGLFQERLICAGVAGMISQLGMVIITSSVVPIPRMISTSGIKGTGFMKCMPICIPPRQPTCRHLITSKRYSACHDVD